MDINIVDDDSNRQKLIRDVYSKCISKDYNGIESMVLEKYTEEDVLQAREDRIYRQNWLIKDYFAPLVSVMVNYPGVDKNNCITLKIMDELSPIIINKFKDKIMYINLRATAEGPVLTLVINEDVKYIKREIGKIKKDCIIGEFMNMNVYDTYGNNLNKEDSSVHSETKRYDIEELKNNIFVKLKEYLRSK